MNSLTIILAIAALAAVAYSLPAPKPTPLEELRRQPALNYMETRDPNNQYELKFETAEGIKVEEHGELRSGVNNTVYLFKSGKSTWKDQDGITYVTNWSSDDMGFHADGAHLPVAPMAV